MKLLIIPFIVTILSSVAFADRTVSIALKSGTSEIELANPSAVSVSYSVQCFQANGTTITPVTGSLNAGASTKVPAGIPDLGACAAGYTSTLLYTDKFGKKVYSCTGTGVNYASASGICGSGRRFCFPALPNTGCGWYFSGPDAWIKNERSPEYYNYGTCTWTALTGSDVIYSTASCGGYSMKESAESMSHNNLYFDTNASASRGAICCEDPVAAGLCKVTVVGSVANGYLSSPQFKGGAPF